MPAQGWAATFNLNPGTVPITDTMMTLRSLLEKSADDDLLFARDRLCGAAAEESQRLIFPRSGTSLRRLCKEAGRFLQVAFFGTSRSMRVARLSSVLESTVSFERLGTWPNLYNDAGQGPQKSSQGGGA